MRIYKGLEGFQQPSFAVVTSGTFDGVHLGHRKILERIREVAQKHGGETVLITFWPHPRLVLYPDDESLKLLSTFEEKAQLLEEAGIDHLISIPFTKEFSSLSSEEFIRQVLIDKIGTKKLIIGYDHRFGKNREGGFEHLLANAAQYGFDVEEIPRQDIDNIGISSTKIRKALELGNVALANEYLGSQYSLTGKVVAGKQIGRKIGFPTANIEIPFKNKLIPFDGIYAIKASLESKEFKGMLYIGHRPTLNGQNRSIEANLFNFDQDIYGKDITIRFIEKIRDDMRFESLEKLTAQLHKDERLAKAILNP